MPNHVSNALIVSGPGAEDFIAQAQTADSGDFIGHFIPMPEDLRGISTGSRTIGGEVVHKWRENDGKPVALTAIDEQHLTDVHGTSDWYQWAQSHWGTKWAAYDVSIEPRLSRIRFDTAWAPPIVAIETISELFPDVTFELAYAEGGSAFFGYTVLNNGGVWDADESEDFWDENALDSDGDRALEPSDACAAHLEKYGLHTGG